MTKFYRTETQLWKKIWAEVVDLDLHEAKVDLVAVWDGKTVTEGVIKIREGKIFPLPF